MYELGKFPIEVSFRELIPELNNSDRSTHLIHTYPAKLIPHIPHFFLNNTVLTKPGDTVLDPFCGSGTVLLESILSDRNAFGVDSNPLARLISSVKTTPYDIDELKLYLNQINEDFHKINEKYIPQVVNINHWFLKHIQDSLGRLNFVIQRIENQPLKDFFLVCLSNCVKKVSLADPRVSVPVRLRYERYNDAHPLKEKTKTRLNNLEKVNVLEKFNVIAVDNIKRFSTMSSLLKARVDIIGKDSRLLTNAMEETSILPDDSVDHILTSPPYGGAQKYIRASSLNLGWLGELNNEKTIAYFEKLSIGREHYKVSEYTELLKTGVIQADIQLEEIRKVNPLRAHIFSKYLIEMRQSLKEMYRVLKKDCFFTLIAANNQVCGEKFETQFFLKEICLDLGFQVVLELVDDIKSYGLMTKRNKTASIITREWVLVFRK